MTIWLYVCDPCDDGKWCCFYCVSFLFGWLFMLNVFAHMHSYSVLYTYMLTERDNFKQWLFECDRTVQYKDDWKHSSSFEFIISWCDAIIWIRKESSFLLLQLWLICYKYAVDSNWTIIIYESSEENNSVSLMCSLH